MTPSDLRAVAATLTDPIHGNAVDAVHWTAAVHGFDAIVRLAEWAAEHLPAANSTARPPGGRPQSRLTHPSP